MNPLERRLVFEQLETRRMLADTIAVQIRIAASSDDAEERPSGKVTLTSSDLELTLDSPNQQTIGMRFGGVSIPQAAHIQNAYLQFQADETGSDPTSLTFRGQAIDSAPTFASTSGSISSRATTAASAPWSPAPWNVRGEAGPDQRTPNLAAVIQEIVNRPGWSSGNSLAIIVTGTGSRTAESFDGAASAAPLLHVEYTLGNAAPNQRPVTTGIADVSVAEDAANSVVDLFAAFSDPEDPDTSLTYSIQANTNPALFAATSINSALGTLTLDYAPNASGTADITVRAADTGFPVLFVETTFTVTVAEVNDIPARTSGTLSSLTVVQNSPAASLGLTNLAYGPGGGSDENGQTLSYRVTTVPSSTLGDIVLADGTTVVTPGPYTLGQIRGMQFKAAADVFGGPETFGFTVTDNGTTVGLNDFQTLSQTIEIRVTEFVPAPVTIEVRLAAGSDDAEEQPSGSVDLNSSDLELTLDKSDQQIVGMRFNGVNLPPGASIQNAYIQFQADETGSTPTSLVINGQASDNATTFASADGNVSNRVKTLASVPWSPAPWNVRGEAGLDQRTPNLAAVIQEIVNRPGWSSGNSLAIIVTGTGARTAESFNGAASAAPLLHVEYVPGNSGPPANRTPAAVNDTATTHHATPVTTYVMLNDGLGDPPTLITSVTQGNNGTVAFDAAAGTTTYTPNNTFLGTDTYTYTITDSDGDTSAAIVTVTVTDGTAPSPIVFRVMGDVPYEDGELDDVEADLANIGAADEFFVHVGDITSGSGPWDESVYTSMASTLETSSIPVFILPGDNEWNDSPDPDRAWSYWEDHLLRLDEHWSYSFTVYRQSVREENFAFVHSGVLFIGINLVGGSVHDEDEWSQRMTDDANWVNENLNNFGSQVTSMVMFGHAFPDPTGDDRQQFGQDFVEAAQAFGKPILYMMGDEHDWTLDNPYSDAPNVTRVVVDQGVPSVRVTVTHDPANPFTFDRTP